MMQVPLLSYPQFSQFLQLQQEQQQLHQHYSRTFLPVVHTGSLGMLSHRSGTSCSEASTGSPTPSPSPPLSVTSENFSSAKNSQVLSKSGKSFTIDAILGIRDREVDQMARDHGGLLTNNYHPRLGLHLSGTKLGMANCYASDVDASGNRLETCARRMDVSRLSAVSREVMSFQLPTDLSSSSVSHSGTTSSRRDLHHPSSYPNSACSRLSEKSGTDVNKKCNGKSKRVRTIFTPEQLERLEAEFERQQYMVGPERLYLAHTLQLTEAQVKVWFQNRRIKWRKQHLEIQQQRLAVIKQQQRRSEEGEEDSDDDSVDSNNYSFSTDTNDNASNCYYKSMENASGLENVNLMQFQVTNEEEASVFQEKDNPSESVKSSSSSEVV